MYSCNSYNKENNNGFDSKLIVIKNNVKIVENGVYNRKMEYVYIYIMEMEMEMEYIIVGGNLCI